MDLFLLNNKLLLKVKETSGIATVVPLIDGEPKLESEMFFGGKTIQCWNSRQIRSDLLQQKIGSLPIQEVPVLSIQYVPTEHLDYVLKSIEHMDLEEVKV